MSDRSDGREYFRQGKFRVTDDMVRARYRSIQLSTIEGVEVSRPLFFMALAGCVGLFGVSLVFIDLLYWYEILLFLGMATGAISLAWNAGSLRVFSKLTREKGWAVYWWIGPLRQMRDAIEQAMEARSRPQGIREDRYSPEPRLVSHQEAPSRPSPPPAHMEAPRLPPAPPQPPREDDRIIIRPGQTPSASAPSARPLPSPPDNDETIRVGPSKRH